MQWKGVSDVLRSYRDDCIELLLPPKIQRVHLNKAMDKRIDLEWSRLKLERPEVVNRTGVK